MAGERGGEFKITVAYLLSAAAIGSVAGGTCVYAYENMSRTQAQAQSSVSRETQEIDLRRAELEVLILINTERRSHGFRLLKWDDQLAEVARGHARDMVTRMYFDHVSPDGENHGVRLTKAGVKYAIAGENLARSRSIPSAHQALLESPSHHHVIDSERFTEVGVGVINDGSRLMVVQLFKG